MQNLVTNEELKAVTGCNSNATLEKLLRAQKVKFLYGNKGQIFTTLEAIHQAMGIQVIDERDNIEFE
jgi:hypothetical protein